MSQYKKPCSFCNQEIEMSGASGKWLPYNLDGTLHDCRSSLSSPSSSPPNTFATVAITSKEVEKEDDRPMNEEKIQIETNDPTIKALLKRINRVEEQINQLLVKFDCIESNKVR